MQKMTKTWVPCPQGKSVVCRGHTSDMAKKVRPKFHLPRKRGGWLGHTEKGCLVHS